MSASSPASGTWLGVQLAAVFQVPPAVLVHAMVAARPREMAARKIPAVKNRVRAPRANRSVNRLLVALTRMAAKTQRVKEIELVSALAHFMAVFSIRVSPRNPYSHWPIGL